MAGFLVKYTCFIAGMDRKRPGFSNQNHLSFFIFRYPGWRGLKKRNRDFWRQWGESSRPSFIELLQQNTLLKSFGWANNGRIPIIDCTILRILFGLEQCWLWNDTMFCVKSLLIMVLRKTDQLFPEPTLLKRDLHMVLPQSSPNTATMQSCRARRKYSELWVCPLLHALFVSPFYRPYNFCLQTDWPC